MSVSSFSSVSQAVQPSKQGSGWKWSVYFSVWIRSMDYSSHWHYFCKQGIMPWTGSQGFQGNESCWWLRSSLPPCQGYGMTDGLPHPLFWSFQLCSWHQPWVPPHKPPLRWRWVQGTSFGKPPQSQERRELWNQVIPKMFPCCLCFFML